LLSSSREEKEEGEIFPTLGHEFHNETHVFVLFYHLLVVHLYIESALEIAKATF